MSRSTTTRNPYEVVQAVAAGVGRLVAGGLTPEQREDQLDQLADLYAEDTDVRHPFSPAGDAPLRTRRQVRDHFAAAGAQLHGVERFAPVDPVVHTTGDPEVVVFEYTRAIRARGHDFTVPCIYVVRVRDGRIVESRDYDDHVALAGGLGRLDALASASKQRWRASAHEEW